MGACTPQTHSTRAKRIPRKRQYYDKKAKTQAPISPDSTRRYMFDQTENFKPKIVNLDRNHSRQSKYSSEPNLEFINVLSRRSSEKKSNIRPTESIQVTDSGAKRLTGRVSKSTSIRSSEMQADGYQRESGDPETFKFNNYFNVPADSGIRDVKVGCPFDITTDFRYSNVNYLDFQSEQCSTIKTRSRTEQQSQQSSIHKVSGTQNGYQIMIKSPTAPSKVHNLNLFQSKSFNEMKTSVNRIQRTNNLYRSNVMPRSEYGGTASSFISNTAGFEA